ncbi:MAG: M23 family metallopeptidase [Trueperaceae bacterium]|nr:M23 family metallopeptidase [Trueperaceae bacterium]
MKKLLFILGFGFFIPLLVISNTSLDADPPQVYIEVPDEVPADTPFNLTLSASEPVTYTIKYAGLELTEVAQNYTLSLLAAEGLQTLEVSAMDGSKNQSSYSYEVYGIATLKASMSLSESVVAGSPTSIKVAWPADGLQPSSVAVYVNGVLEPLYQKGNEAIALAGIPLGSPSQTVPVQAVLADSYGRTVTLNKQLTVVADEREVENLNLTETTYSVVTAEAQEREREALDGAYQSARTRPLPLWREPFVIPIEGRMTSGYGTPRRYISGGNVSFHTGADIAAPQGTPIRASNDGVVLISNFYPIKGGLTVIDHGASVFSFYFHQSKFLVQVGDTVKRGQIIGEVGTTGLSTGPHLHWEMQINGVPTNPLDWVDKLLP